MEKIEHKKPFPDSKPDEAVDEYFRRLTTEEFIWFVDHKTMPFYKNVFFGAIARNEIRKELKRRIENGK